MSESLTPVRAVVYFADGRVGLTRVSSLEDLQTLVEGYVQIVPLPEDIREKFVFYCNEEGLLQGLQPNLAASVLCRQLLVGNVVVVQKA